MWMSPFGYKTKCHDNCLRKTLWFEIEGIYGANSLIWIILWKWWEPGTWCHSACSGDVSLSLVVSPGSEGMQGWWWLEVNGCCCLERLMFSSSWVIAMDRYVIITICYALWLSCCAESWGLHRDETARTELDHRFQRTKLRKGKSKKLNASHFWMSWKKPSICTGRVLRSSFSRITVKSN